MIRGLPLSITFSAIALLAACESNPRPNGSNLAAEGRSACAAPAALDEATREALIEALDDERHAFAMYNAVIRTFGNVRPFANIVHAEQRHIDALLPLFGRDNVEVPDDRWADHDFDLPPTLRAVCAASAEAEVANIAIDDRFLKFVKEPDIRSTFEYLRAASADNHLPAFRRCAQRRR